MSKNYIKSFAAAFRGITDFYRLEFNAWVHLTAAGASLFLAWQLNLSASEWLFLCTAIAAVFVSELFNTAIERLCDLRTTEIDPQIRIIKDMSAAAVLLSCIFALIVGSVIFIPKCI